MSGNAQKTPIAQSLHRFAEQKVMSAIQLLGKALPCSVVSASGAIVTVKFELNTIFTLPSVTVPLAGAEYVRYPIQPGCKGVVFPVDTSIGLITGLGSASPDLSIPGNLQSLVFVPCGNVSWFAVDPLSVVIYGPNGATLRTQDGTCTLVLTPNGVEVTVPVGKKLTVNGDSRFVGNMSISGTVTSDQAGGVGLTTHHHTGVQSGPSNTGGPVG